MESIASLVGTNKIAGSGISAFLRENLEANPSEIESLAAEIARTSPHPAERNQRLSSLRMLLRNVCDELGLPKHTVKRRGSTYRIERSVETVRRATGPLNPSIYRPLQQAAQKATPAQKELMLSVVMEILGITRQP